MKKIKGRFIALLSLFVMLLFTSNVNAATMSDEFKSYLNEEGKFVVNSIKPTNDEEFWSIFETLYYDVDEDKMLVAAENPNSDYTSATIKFNPYTDEEESYTLSLVYEYDEDIKKIVDGYIKEIPEDKDKFAVNDMEVINFIYNGKGDEKNLVKYSGELKEYINYKNFSVGIRMGCDDRFFTEALGIASFNYNNTFYGMLSGPRGAIAKHIIYVPDSTGDTKEELMQAAQKRIDDYIGKGKITLSYLGTGIYDLYMDEYEAQLEEYQEKLNEITELLATLPNGSQEWAEAELDRMYYESQVSQYQDYIEYFRQDWENGEAYAFLKEAEGDFYFNLKVFKGTEDEKDYNFIIIKDSSKMVNPTTKTSDAKTDITITPSSNAIPLDTVIKADKLTSGTEYENIIKVLDVETYETFDLTLYSESANKNITSGEFEVQIPVSDALKGKTLMAYYVGEDNKIEEYDVDLTTKEGYAIFKTKHFSIYTLAEKKVEENTQENIPSNVPEQKPAGEKDDTPKTGAVDITGYVLLATIVSMLGLGILTKKMVK